jgi:hypothetical protein
MRDSRLSNGAGAINTAAGGIDAAHGPISVNRYPRAFVADLFFAGVFLGVAAIVIPILVYIFGGEDRWTYVIASAVLLWMLAGASVLPVFVWRNRKQSHVEIGRLGVRNSGGEWLLWEEITDIEKGDALPQYTITGPPAKARVTIDAILLDSGEAITRVLRKATKFRKSREHKLRWPMRSPRPATTALTDEGFGGAINVLALEGDRLVLHYRTRTREIPLQHISRVAVARGGGSFAVMETVLWLRDGEAVPFVPRGLSPVDVFYAMDRVLVHAPYEPQEGMPFDARVPGHLWMRQIRIHLCLAMLALLGGCVTVGEYVGTAGAVSVSRGGERVSYVEEAAPLVTEEVLRFTKVENGVVVEIPVYKLGANVHGFVAGLAIDVDGSPRAYHPDNIGLDYLANAGMPVLDSGRKLSIRDPDWQRTWKAYYARAREERFRGPTRFVWHGVVASGQNEPVVQGPGDPAPGFYVSQTSLFDRGIADRTNPRRYVDSCEIPYIALPPSVLAATGVAMGDLAAVQRPDTGALAFAIVADVGPATQLGEGSVKLAQLLGHNPIRPGNPPRAILGLSRDVIYLLFSGSGTGDVMRLEEIETKGAALLEAWGGDLGTALSGMMDAN